MPTTLPGIPWLVAVTGVVAAVSLLGLFHPSMPLRTPLALSAVLGMCLLDGGHASSGRARSTGGPATFSTARSRRSATCTRSTPSCDSPGVGVRALVPSFAWRRMFGIPLARQTRCRPGIAWTRRIAIGVVVVLLLASAAPMFTNRLRKPGWEEIPRAWYDAVEWIEADGPGSTLVLPSTAFGQQRWGTTVDEPIQGLSDVPWVARTQIPLVPP